MSSTLNINAATSPKEGPTKEQETKDQYSACSGQQSNAISEHEEKAEVVYEQYPGESVLELEVHLHSRGFWNSANKDWSLLLSLSSMSQKLELGWTTMT
jgi:hypothetical protein